MLAGQIKPYGSAGRWHGDSADPLASIAPSVEAIPDSASDRNRFGHVHGNALLVLRGGDIVRQVPQSAVDSDPGPLHASVDHEERTGPETCFVRRPTACAADACHPCGILGLPVTCRGVVPVPICELETAVRLRDGFKLDRRANGMEAAVRFRTN